MPGGSDGGGGGGRGWAVEEGLEGSSHLFWVPCLYMGTSVSD